MIKAEEGESRLQYLSRVLTAYMAKYGMDGSTVDYDGTDCDGWCLAEDIKSAIESLPEGPIETSITIMVSSLPPAPELEAQLREAMVNIFGDGK